jgi:hypothetical protein
VGEKLGLADPLKGAVCPCWLANMSIGGTTRGLGLAPPTTNSVPIATAAEATPTAT